MTVAFVAEVSSNHNRDLDRCLAFIDTAAELGCDAVKFQLFKVAELFAPDVLAKSEELRRREAWELPVSFLPDLAARCRKAGVRFGCTPFYLEAFAELLPHVDFYKVASYELLWDDLLVACAHTGKPLVLSTGMATLDEVKRAITVLREAGCNDLTLLHCVSGYPVALHDANLAAIKTLSVACKCPVGWSDHTMDPAVIYRAVHRWGATIVEFHMDLEGGGEEYTGGHCWLPEQIRPVIEIVRSGFRADGTGEKVPQVSELEERDWRADPGDGLRPMAHVRATWSG